MAPRILTLGLPGGPAYLGKVLRVQPDDLIAAWPLAEAVGTKAKNLARSGSARDGAYTGVSLGQFGIGDGRRCPWFDGTGDYVDVYTTGLRDAWNGAELTILAWAKVNAAAVWTDVANRNALSLEADIQNYAELRKSSTSNVFNFNYRAGNTLKQVSLSSFSPTAWRCYVLTVSVGGNAMKAYVNGVQQGTTQTSLGTWAGSLASTTCTIGSGSTTPVVPWHGWIGPVFVWKRALTADEVKRISHV